MDEKKLHISWIMSRKNKMLLNYAKKNQLYSSQNKSRYLEI